MLTPLYFLGFPAMSRELDSWLGAAADLSERGGAGGLEHQVEMPVY